MSVVKGPLSSVRVGQLVQPTTDSTWVPRASELTLEDREWRPELEPSSVGPELLRVVRKQERVQRRMLAAADACAAPASVIAAALLSGLHPTWLLVLLAPAVVLLAKLQGLYDRDQLVIRKSTLRDLPQLLEVATVATLIVYFARDRLLSGSAGSPEFFLKSGLVMLTALSLARRAARALARSWVEPERCLILGDIEVANGLKRWIASIDGVHLVGAVATADLPLTPGELGALVVATRAHRLIIAPERGLPGWQTGELIHAARATGIRVSVTLGAIATFGGAGLTDQFGAYTLFGLPRFGLSRSSSAIKRAFDLAGASVAIVGLSPLMLAIALAIKVDSTGPALFRQVRVGRRGRRFHIIKFRSMVDGAEAMKVELLAHNEAGDGMFKITSDPRVTRVGTWLRRSRADELPQLFNVLRGEMSIVGPRPLVVEEDDRIVGYRRGRLQLMPGMTGPWQILGTRSLSIAEMADLDCAYVAKWSLWGDVCILLQTFGLVAGNRGV